jgi:ribose 5-phosphate isomerase A
MLMAHEQAKRVAAREAAKLIEPETVVGLGTGSTATFFIEELASRVEKEQLTLKAVVASSRQSGELAKRLGLPLKDINDVFNIDITVDGADEVDPQKRLIKGHGGAHVREKILASSSKEMVVIADDSKLVDVLGVGALPVEVILFGSPATRMKIDNLGHKGAWRMDKEGSLFLTENGNLLYDISFETPLTHPEQTHEELIHLPGVVDTGFFFNLAKRIVVGWDSGKFEIL